MPKTESTPSVGHNSGVSSEQLKSIIERLERLIEDKKAVAEDIKEVMAEAKGNGFDARAIREVLKFRALDKAAAEEREALRDLYLSTLGLI